MTATGKQFLAIDGGTFNEAQGRSKLATATINELASIIAQLELRDSHQLPEHTSVLYIPNIV